MGMATPTYIHAWVFNGEIMIFFQNIPNIELTAIKTMDVGVAVFSVTRNSNVRILKQQISIPVPDNPVNIPPMNPMRQESQKIEEEEQSQVSELIVNETSS